ncbi:MAG: acetylglutamate kinase [Nonlabens sp.]|nr:acetylglutamate kinase [Nonlabens sp.]
MKNTLKIIKIGGNIIDDAVALTTFLKDFATIKSPKILVHGGGKLATRLADDLQIPVNMIDGRRVTDQQTLDVITMVYAGKINKNIVAQLQAQDCNAIGFTGADGNTIIAVKRPVQEVDYGFVGDVEQVKTSTLELLLTNNITPIFCAITHDANGQLLNTNADTIAAELAIAFASSYDVSLYYCFEKNGVLKNVDDEESVIDHIDTKSYKSLLETGVIANGMLPKLNNCFHALNNNVQTVCIGQTSMLFNKNSKHTTMVL